jgi:hypothetical protein
MSGSYLDAMPDLPLRPPGRGPTATAARRHRGRLDPPKDVPAIALRGRRRTSMVGSAVVEDNALREGDPTLAGANPRVDRLRAPGLGRRNATAQRRHAHPRVSVTHR